MIYSCIAGGYDTVKKHDVPVWTCDENDVPYHHSDLCRVAKFAKILCYFGDDCSVWIDGSITLNEGITFRDMVDEHLRDVDIAVMKHPHRDCVYQEAKACIERGKDDPETINAQIARYMAEGYPSSYLLAETGVLMRRHTPEVKAFCSLWWDEIARGSRRDQISFPYVAWKLKMPYKMIEKRFFTVHPHTRAA